MDKKSRIAIWVAVIGAIATISVAAIQYGPRWISRAKEQGKGQNQNESVIAGRVVDLDTNLAIPEADISVNGKASGYITENNGNFRFKITNSSEGQSVRLRVDKPGYISWDRAVGVPSEDLIIQLQRSSR